MLIPPVLPLLAINLLSGGAHGQTSIHFHYTAGEIPILIAAYGAGCRLARAAAVRTWKIPAIG